MPKLFCYVYGFEIKIHLMFGLIPSLIIVLYNVSIGNHIVWSCIQAEEDIWVFHHWIISSYKFQLGDNSWMRKEQNCKYHILNRLSLIFRNEIKTEITYELIRLSLIFRNEIKSGYHWWGSLCSIVSLLCNVLLIIVRISSFDHYVVCSSSIYGGPGGSMS
jgi:hypothetical protein